MFRQVLKMKLKYKSIHNKKLKQLKIRKEMINKMLPMIKYKMGKNN